jgi:hypothetical protein
MLNDDVETDGPKRPSSMLRPPSPGAEDMVWIAKGGGDREHEDIMLRRVPRGVAYRFRGAAGARGLTHAQYLCALVNLHETMRQRSDGGDAEATAVLEELGLRTVSI